jgi:hypothetical protein
VPRISATPTRLVGQSELAPPATSRFAPLDLDSWPWPLAAAALAAAALVVVFAIIPEIFIPDASLGWVDAWYYVRFARTLPASLPRYSFLYQSERLAWMIPAYLVNRFTTPLAANYIVKSTFFIANVIFLYGAVRQLSGARTARFVGALAATYSFVLHSFGANYADGPANTYLLMSIYMINRALVDKASEVRDAFLSGAAYLALLLTQFVFIFVAPLFAMYAGWTYLQTRRRTGVRFGVVACAFVAGAAVASGATIFAYLYWHVPSPPLWRSVHVLNAHDPNHLIWPASRRWILHSYWLVLPAFVSVWIFARLASALKKGVAAVAELPAYYWLFLGMCGFWSAVYFANAPWIMMPFYASFLIPSTFLALGSLLQPLIDQLPKRWYERAVGSVFLVAAIAYAFGRDSYAIGAVILGSACLAAATFLQVGIVSRRAWRAPAFVVLLILGIGALDFGTTDYNVQFWNGYKYTRMSQIYHPPSPGTRWAISRADAFRAAVDTSARIAPRIGDRPYYFWYDGDDPLGIFFRSIGSLFFAWSADTLLDEHFRNIDGDTIDRLEASGRDVLILTRRENVPLSDARLELRWSEAFEAAGTRYYAHYFALRAPSQPES